MAQMTLTFTVETRRAQALLRILKPLVLLRVVSVDRATCWVMKFVRIKVGD